MQSQHFLSVAYHTMASYPLLLLRNGQDSSPPPPPRVWTPVHILNPPTCYTFPTIVGVMNGGVVKGFAQIECIQTLGPPGPEAVNVGTYTQ